MLSATKTVAHAHFCMQLHYRKQNKKKTTTPKPMFHAFHTNSSRIHGIFPFVSMWGKPSMAHIRFIHVKIRRSFGISVCNIFKFCARNSFTNGIHYNGLPLPSVRCFDCWISVHFESEREYLQKRIQKTISCDNVILHLINEGNSRRYTIFRKILYKRFDLSIGKVGKYLNIYLKIILCKLYEQSEEM